MPVFHDKSPAALGAAVFLFLLSAAGADEPKPFAPDEFRDAVCLYASGIDAGTEQRIIASLNAGIPLPKDCSDESLFARLVSRSDNPELFSLFLARGFDADYQFAGAASARMTAFGIKKLPAAEPFINAGSYDLSRKSPNGDTLLIEALSNDKDSGVFTAVMRHGADARGVKAKGRLGESPLMLAAKRVYGLEYGKDEEILGLFKKYGADFNELSSRGLPLIQEAALKDGRIDYRTDFMKFLVANGASPNTKNKKGEPFLNFMFHRNLSGTVFDRVMEFAPDIEIRDDLGNTALLAVFEYIGGNSDNRIYCARKLAEAGADVNAVNKRGVNPLTAAIMAGARNRFNPGVIELFLAKGAKVQSKTPDGIGLMFYAGLAKLTRSEIQKLKEAGADVNEVEAQTGLTPLIAAALTGNGGAVSSLVKAGADAGAADKEGRTALMAIALTKPDIATFRSLINAGAAVTARDRAGRTALDYFEMSSFAGDPRNEKQLGSYREMLSEKKENQ